MILLRQKLYAKAERNSKSIRKQHRAAKKAWEQQQGDKIIGYNEGILSGIVDADAQARDAIQKEKNGAKTIKAGSGFWFKGKKWKDEVDPKTIEVKEDEISRKKFRDSVAKAKEHENWLLNEYRDKSGLFGSEELEYLRKKRVQNSIKKG